MRWPTVSLKEEASLITKGTTPTSLGHAFADRGIPFLRAQNLVGGTISVDADPMFISTDTHEALRRSIIQPNDVLISIAGTIGRAAVVPSEAEEMNCNQAVAIVRPSDKFNRRFLLYWLSSDDALSQLSKGKVTGVISNLSLGQIGQFKIPLPPLEEQKRIAAILDQADALRRLRRRALDRINTLGQAIFHEMFGDLVGNERQYPSREIGDVIAGFDTGKNLAQDPNADADAIHRVLKISAVTSGVFKPEESKPLPHSYRPPASHIVHDDDLLFSRANTTALIGATAFVRGAKGDLVLPDKLWRFKWKNASLVLPKFMKALFSSPAFRYEIGKRSTGTSGSMKNIGKKKVLTIVVGIPTLLEQEIYCQKLDAIETVLNSQTLAAMNAQSLFTTLQNRAFRGDL